MSESGWTGVFIILSVALLCLALYLLGYRLTGRKERKASHEPIFSKTGALVEIQDPSPPETEAIMALGKIEDGVILIVDGDKVRYINDAASRIFGVVADRCPGRTFIEVVRDYECDSLLRKCAVTGVLQVAVIRTHQKKQILRVIILPGSEKNGYVVTIQNLTEKSKIEEMRKDLVSNVAHEFRTPIASIRLLAETLIGGASKNPSILADYLTKIHTESEKLQHMAEDLNELWRLESNSATMEKSRADLHRLILQTVGRLHAQAERKGISIKVNIAPDILRPLINRDSIESVLINLIFNAIRYTGSGGAISINAISGNDEIQVSVSDTGVGIPPDELPRVFERFYKVDKSRNSEGSGLGLSISKHVIAAHNGRIWVESEEGKGSTFHFTLPLKG